MLTTFTAASVAEAATVIGHWGGPWGGGFPWPLIFIPLFWIAIFVGLFVFAGRRRRERFAQRDWHASSGSRSAEKTLAERFAKGDIDETEYRARLEVLRANRPESNTP